MKNSIVVFGLCICMIFLCTGCGKKVEKQTFGQEGKVSMSATLTEDEKATLVCTVFNKTKEDIVTGTEYSLQVFKEDSFVDVPILPNVGFNLVAINISAEFDLP